MKSMKSTLYLIAAFALIALNAVFVIGAHAATLPHNFTDDNGNNFSLAAAYNVEKVAGAVKVVQQNGTQYTYADASGALYTKTVNYMATSGRWYQLPGTFTHVNVTEALNIGCYGSGGSQTVLSYAGGSYAKFVADGCAARAAIADLSN